MKSIQCRLDSQGRIFCRAANFDFRVGMKCKFGCGEYRRGGACPSNTPSVAECAQFFNEYSDALILHFEGDMDKPEDRHAWSRKINAKLVKLEREVFLAGYERAFLLFMDSCCFCKECTGDRLLNFLDKQIITE